MVNATKFFVLLPGVPGCASGSPSPPSLTSFLHDAEFLEFFHLNDSTQTIAPLLTPFPLDFLQKKDLSQFQNTKYSSLKILSRKKFRAPAPPEKLVRSPFLLEKIYSSKPKLMNS
jgi:hypothetical protein